MWGAAPLWSPSLHHDAGEGMEVVRPVSSRQRPSAAAQQGRQTAWHRQQHWSSVGWGCRLGAVHARLPHHPCRVPACPFLCCSHQPPVPVLLGVAQEPVARRRHQGGCLQGASRQGAAVGNKSRPNQRGGATFTGCNACCYCRNLQPQPNSRAGALPWASDAAAGHALLRFVYSTPLLGRRCPGHCVQRLWRDVDAAAADLCARGGG